MISIKRKLLGVVVVRLLITDIHAKGWFRDTHLIEEAMETMQSLNVAYWADQ